MRIHFVCTGNTFRSRLAEAYLKSKELPDLIVSSSGIEAEKNFNGPVCYYTVHILGENHLIKYLSESWTMTTKEELEKQNLVVFMHKEHHDYCLGKLQAKIPHFELWDIPDVGEYLPGIPTNPDDIVKIAEKVYELIETNVDQRILEPIIS